MIDISKSTERQAMQEAMSTLWSLICFQIWRSNFFLWWWINAHVGWDSACPVGHALAMLRVTFAVQCYDGFGLSSGIGGPYTNLIAIADILRQALSTDFHDFQVEERNQQGILPGRASYFCMWNNLDINAVTRSKIEVLMQGRWFQDLTTEGVFEILSSAPK